MRQPRPQRLLPIVALALLGSISPARAQPTPPAAGMKPYTESIPGTDLTFDMVPIPGGKFVIGSPPEETDRGDDEGPQRPVEVAPFWMGKHEVLWDSFDIYAYSLDLKKKAREGVDITKQPESEKAADAVTRPTPPYADMTFGLGHYGQPAICMTHHAAMEYCRWLSAKTGTLYRLPTEAEWEYACRAGTTTAYSFGDDPAQLPEHAWFYEDTQKPMPIGKKKPNPWGLYDMHGNVWEWCLDRYVPDVYATFPPDQPAKNPVVLPDAQEYPYVLRGGSWDDDPDRLRSAARWGSDPEFSIQDPQRPQSIWWHTDARYIGFRVVRPLEEQEMLRGLKSPIVKGAGTK